jgi:hypothetical protein
LFGINWIEIWECGGFGTVWGGIVADLLLGFERTERKIAQGPPDHDCAYGLNFLLFN